VASVSLKLCDVFPDGTSSLVCRGFLNLTHGSSSVSPQPLTVDRSASWLELPSAGETVAVPARPFVAPPEAETSDVEWHESRDVLRRRTTRSDAQRQRTRSTAGP
jgi:hypothetical protein